MSKLRTQSNFHDGGRSYNTTALQALRGLASVVDLLDAEAFLNVVSHRATDAQVQRAALRPTVAEALSQANQPVAITLAFSLRLERHSHNAAD